MGYPILRGQCKTACWGKEDHLVMITNVGSDDGSARSDDAAQGLLLQYQVYTLVEPHSAAVTRPRRN
jgi:hypothetical protein